MNEKENHTLKCTLKKNTHENEFPLEQINNFLFKR